MKIFTRRFWRFFWQRCTRGWDDSDTWNLDTTAAKFLLPRLRRFKELNDGHPCDISFEEWERIIDEITWLLEKSIDDDELFEPPMNEKVERIRKAEEYLGKYFRHLWW